MTLSKPIITVKKDDGTSTNKNTIYMKPKSNITIEVVKSNPNITIEVVHDNDTNSFKNGLGLKEVYSGGEYISNLKSEDGYGVNWYNKLVDIANKHGISGEDLLSIINLESSLNADNSNGSHLGYMQMDDDCFSEAGYTKDEYLKMNPVEKLDVIDAHLYNLDKKCGKETGTASIEDYYAANLLPANAKNNVVIDKSNRAESYEANKGLDFNNDGKITKIELKQKLESKKVDVSSFLD